MFDQKLAQDFVNQKWDEEIIPELVEYIKIPNKSPMFDPDWKANGYMDQVVEQFRAWCARQDLPGMQIEVCQLPGRTPLLLLEVPGQGEDCVLLYGHLDKQPEMVGWDDDLGPWKPVIKDDKLYGRGGADDGYACFASLTAILALQKQKLPHARCVVMIEACEESGSADLPYYVDHLAERIGKPSLVVCLDSGAGNYEQMWLTTSLRGMCAGALRVDILEEGVHSGGASGIVPSSYRIMNQLLARLEDRDTGELTPDWLKVEIPQQRREQAAAAAEIMGEGVTEQFPFVEGAQAMGDNGAELILNRTWRATLSYIGIDGMPPLDSAGNVLRPYTTAMLSFRLPPTLDAAQAEQQISQLLLDNPPYKAKVSFTTEKSASGWHAPPLAQWLEQAVSEASEQSFGKSVAYIGEGGTIPFMGMLGEKFPAAQFVITGVLGPASNAHGPNEFLHIPTGKKLTAAVANILHKHYLAGEAGLTYGEAASDQQSDFPESCC